MNTPEHSDGNLPPASPDSATTVPQWRPEEKADDQIGRYKLLQKLGEGGCGTVYLAEQSEPVHRRVAVKVIKLGMDTKEVIARFEAERQALAMMDHPNIAKVFDAGTTEGGRPYFVMELVQGVPITTFCDEKKLSTAARLELFIQVCHAVQHAHQKGIIHRDIKPSNILVALHDDQPVPKVIDFGIAKATAGRLTDQTLYTAVEQFIGTPAYMSPEQAQVSAVDIDTRSDIYSLGVLLYELLTGRTPFDTSELLKVGLDEMRRHIREIDPPRPSTRLSTLQGDALSATALLRQIAPPKLINLVRGDLDWIVMRCLEKDRARRYETADRLADDLGRHLVHEPVSARPPSLGYLLQKLVRRHRMAFAAASVTTCGLVLGLGVSTYLFFREKAALAVAETERRKAEAANTRTLTAMQALQVAKDQAEAALKKSEAAEIEANRQREVAVNANQRTRKVEAEKTALETRYDRERRRATVLAEAFKEQEVELKRLQLPDDEKLNRALATVAEREKVTEGQYWAEIRQFIAAVRADPRANYRDRALADFAERKSLEAVVAQVVAQIQPSGMIMVRGAPRLIFANKLFEVGTRFTATYNKQDYELELVDVDRTTFTIRYQGENFVRPIKPAR